MLLVVLAVTVCAVTSLYAQACDQTQSCEGQGGGTNPGGSGTGNNNGQDTTGVSTTRTDLTTASTSADPVINLTPSRTTTTANGDTTDLQNLGGIASTDAGAAGSTVTIASGQGPGATQTGGTNEQAVEDTNKQSNSGKLGDPVSFATATLQDPDSDLRILIIYIAREPPWDFLGTCTRRNLIAGVHTSLFIAGVSS